MWIKVIKEVATKIALALLTEKVIKKLVILLLRKLAERTDNKIDDDVVKVVEDALADKPAQ